MPAATASHHRARQAWQQGLSSARQGRWLQAADAYRKACRLHPQDALYGMNLADALLRLDRAQEALDAARAAVAAEPLQPLAHRLQLKALAALGRHEELVDEAQRVPPQAMSADAWGLVGAAQMHLGLPRQAVGRLLQGLTLEPAHSHMHFRLGLAFNALGMKAEAAECLRTALLLGLGPLELGARDLLAYHEREICDWRDAGHYEARAASVIRALEEDAALELNPFVHATLLDDPALQHCAARAVGRWLDRQVCPLPPRRPVRGPRIRIGYASADISRHATAHLMAELMERHDRSRFELHLYTFGKDDGSPVRQRILAACEHVIEAREMTVPAMARRIRADQIDILVDLKGYTRDARPALYHYRPAPVQVSYLGFPGTTGQTCMDYVVGDPWVTPLDSQPHFTERIAQLPGCYQCNDGTRALPVPPERASVGLPEQALVLCGFNQPYKISPEVFDLWCRLLHRLPQAVLWLLAWNEAAPATLRREAEARGIPAERIVFAPPLPQEQHLNRIGCADLFLDTWPCNGHTTASDMLWGGVPVVTWSGRTFASRVAGSLLHAMGLGDTVCADPAAYEERVVTLAQDEQARLALRTRVAAARHSAPLFDGARLAVELESLYERMWERALSGLPPATLPAQAASASVQFEAMRQAISP
jgi:predicted O-linked N-acetylglucosamine transferase (SPINDLY family)